MFDFLKYKEIKSKLEINKEDSESSTSAGLKYFFIKNYIDHLLILKLNLSLVEAEFCQGTSLAVCTPLYTLFIIHILHSFYFAYIHLLLFGYHLNLSCSQ